MIFHIDGFNLYYGLKDKNWKRWAERDVQQVGWGLRPHFRW